MNNKMKMTVLLAVILFACVMAATVAALNTDMYSGDNGMSLGAGNDEPVATVKWPSGEAGYATLEEAIKDANEKAMKYGLVQIILNKDYTLKNSQALNTGVSMIVKKDVTLTLDSGGDLVELAITGKSTLDISGSVTGQSGKGRIALKSDNVDIPKVIFRNGSTYINDKDVELIGTDDKAVFKPTDTSGYITCEAKSIITTDNNVTKGGDDHLYTVYGKFDVGTTTEIPAEAYTRIFYIDDNTELHVKKQLNAKSDNLYMVTNGKVFVDEGATVVLSPEKVIYGTGSMDFASNSTWKTDSKTTLLGTTTDAYFNLESKEDKLEVKFPTDMTVTDRSCNLIPNKNLLFNKTPETISGINISIGNGVTLTLKSELHFSGTILIDNGGIVKSADDKGTGKIVLEKGDVVSGKMVLCYGGVYSSLYTFGKGEKAVLELKNDSTLTVGYVKIGKSTAFCYELNGNATVDTSSIKSTPVLRGGSNFIIDAESSLTVSGQLDLLNTDGDPSTLCNNGTMVLLTGSSLFMRGIGSSNGSIVINKGADVYMGMNHAFGGNDAIATVTEGKVTMIMKAGIINEQKIILDGKMTTNAGQQFAAGEGAIEISKDSKLTVEGSFGGGGKISLANGAAIVNNGEIEFNPASKFDRILLSGEFTNNGTVTFKDGTILGMGTFKLTNNGTFDMTGTMSPKLGEYSIVNYGTFTDSNGNSFGKTDDCLIRFSEGKQNYLEISTKFEDSEMYRIWTIHGEATTNIVEQCFIDDNTVEDKVYIAGDAKVIVNELNLLFPETNAAELHIDGQMEVAGTLRACKIYTNDDNPIKFNKGCNFILYDFSSGVAMVVDMLGGDNPIMTINDGYMTYTSVNNGFAVDNGYIAVMMYGEGTFNKAGETIMPIFLQNGVSIEIIVMPGSTGTLDGKIESITVLPGGKLVKNGFEFESVLYYEHEFNGKTITVEAYGSLEGNGKHKGGTLVLLENLEKYDVKVSADTFIIPKKVTFTGFIDFSKEINSIVVEGTFDAKTGMNCKYLTIDGSFKCDASQLQIKYLVLGKDAVIGDCPNEVFTQVQGIYLENGGMDIPYVAYCKDLRLVATNDDKYEGSIIYTMQLSNCVFAGERPVSYVHILNGGRKATTFNDVINCIGPKYNADNVKGWTVALDFFVRVVDKETGVEHTEERTALLKLTSTKDYIQPIADTINITIGIGKEVTPPVISSEILMTPVIGGGEIQQYIETTVSVADGKMFIDFEKIGKGSSFNYDFAFADVSFTKLDGNGDPITVSNVYQVQIIDGQPCFPNGVRLPFDDVKSIDVCVYGAIYPVQDHETLILTLVGYDTWTSASEVQPQSGEDNQCLCEERNDGALNAYRFARAAKA